MRQRLAEHPIIKFLASDKITVFCLFWLFVLTFWGTIAQVQNGLYPAQARYFSSMIFLVWNFIPLPGARLILWAFFVNLVLVALVRFEYQWRKFGLLVVHAGILLLLASAFVTFHYANESHLTLFEGEGGNTSSSYHDWEFAAWRGTGEKHDIIAYDASSLKDGRVLYFEEFPFQVFVRNYYPNAKAFLANLPDAQEDVVNVSGINLLKKVETFLDPEKNTPGVNLLLKTDSKEAKLILYGDEAEPTSLHINGEKYFFELRHKHFLLPFIAKLIEFRMEEHPGTDVARSYESTLEVQMPHMSREAVISMNNPFRYRDYTLYQASYAIDNFGRKQSTIAVVKNMGRLLPYIATLTTFLGLFIHFIFMVWNHLANEKT